MPFLTKQKAFTLIEVMAAVAVFTISSVALFTVNQQSVLLANRLENKTIAHWVALNSFNRLEIKKELTTIGSQLSSEEMAGIKWQINTEVKETPIATVHRIAITVSDEDQQQYAFIEGFIGSRSPIKSGF